MENRLEYETISRLDFISALGIEDDGCIFPSDGRNLSYYALTKAEMEQVLLEVLQAIEKPTLQRVGQHRKPIWELAWKTQAEKFSTKHYAWDGLVPEFMSATPIVRFQQRYIRPQRPDFEFAFFDSFRSWLFKAYCMDAPIIYEFGCGSGFNLVALSAMNPRIRMVGLDWAEHSNRLIEEISRTHQLNLESKTFNFFEPTENLRLDPQGIALTICALEQVGEQFMPFVDYLLQQKPRLCIHIEPIYEFYDSSNLLDYLAIKYHEKRNYLRGFWPCLRELESQGRILIHKARRLHFGSLFHEAYNYVIWEPL